MLPLLLTAAALAAPCDVVYADDVAWDGIAHDSFQYTYRAPFGAVAAGSGSVRLVLRACDQDLSGARVRLWDARTQTERWETMHKAAFSSDPALGPLSWWKLDLVLPAEPTVLYYFFELTDGRDTDYYVDDEPVFYGGGEGAVSDGWDDSRSFQITVYDPAFAVPEWAQGALYYQIFPDRFRDGDPSNNPAEGGWAYGGYSYQTLPWDGTFAGDCAGSDQARAQCFAGGDLAGITAQLGWLYDLGVDAIYLNPIFESHTNHRYDTVDWLRIDSELGTEADYDALIAQAGALDMRVVLDGVFNHASADGPLFDLYSRWDASGALSSPDGPGTDDGSGACESPDAATRAWFFLPAVDKAGVDEAGAQVLCEGSTYEAWGTYFHIPKLNPTAGGVQDLFWAQGAAAVGPYWVGRGASGWRLDVGAEVDPGLAHPDNNGFWEGFRAAVRAVNPEAVLIGEEWDDKSRLLLGQEYDTLMNYRFRAAVLDWLFDTCTGNGCDGSSFTDEDSAPWRESGSIDAIDEAQLALRLLAIAEDTPPAAHHAMMNLLGSHDTARLRWLLTQVSGGDEALAAQKLRLGTLLQFTWPGSPTIYYGDEVGVLGASVWDGSLWRDDPTSRAPMPWADLGGSPDTALLAWYQALGALRARLPALRSADAELVLADPVARVFAFARGEGEERVLVVLHRAAAPAAVTLDVEELFADGVTLWDQLGGGSVTVSDEQLTLHLEGLSGAVLAQSPPPEDSGLDSAPDSEAPDSEAPDSTAPDSEAADDSAPPDGDNPDYYYKGCACAVAPRPATPAWAALGLLWLWARRRPR